MASYITQTDIENRFGAHNVKKWSNLDNRQSGMDADRIAEAISQSESVIDDRLRGGVYAVPIVGTSGSTPTVVKGWAATLAGCWLYNSRGMADEDETGDKLTELENRVHKEIDAYASGARTLAAVTNESDSPSAPTVV